MFNKNWESSKYTLTTRIPRKNSGKVQKMCSEDTIQGGATTSFFRLTDALEGAWASRSHSKDCFSCPKKKLMPISQNRVKHLDSFYPEQGRCHEVHPMNRLIAIYTLQFQ